MRTTMMLGAFAAAASAAVLVGTGAGDAAPASPTPNRTLHFDVSLASQRFVDTGAKGNSVGDLVVIADHYRAPGADRIIGRDWESCTVVGLRPVRVSCTFTTRLPHGKITSAGTFRPMRLPWRISVTGGTGRYAGARGVLVADSGKDRTERFTFALG